METTNLTHIAHLAEICVQRGIRNVVLSPGSRNAPLIIAFDEHPEIKTWLIHDERCAAFFAIGLSEALHEPVAITCTSGSAPLNYSPGLAEAYYRNIPVLVLTADRPAEWIDQGDGQTIRQQNVFNNFIKAQFNLPEFHSENDVISSDKIVNVALTELITIPSGPVHVNIPLNEPLYGTRLLQTVPAIEIPEIADAVLSTTEKSIVEKEWRSAEKKLILVGQHAPDRRLLESMQGVINDPSVAILVENTSNLRHFQKIVHCIDRTLAVIGEDELEAFAPDLLVTLGGAVISKKIKAYLRTHKPKVNWRVGQFLFEEDTYKSLTHSFNCSPYHFFEWVSSIHYVPRSTYGDKWKQKDFIGKQRHEEYLAQTRFCDFKAFGHLVDTLPFNSNLHMGNSSVPSHGQ
jgi:2-succinyl-5-enolpyruvyl-6-hydroxy-3-cyclohexene-1-carboxylate synthase